MQSTVAKANEYFIICFVLNHLFIQFSLSSVPLSSLSLAALSLSSLSHRPLSPSHWLLSLSHTHWSLYLRAFAIYPLLQCCQHLGFMSLLKSVWFE
jgi:hypothetical protein